MGPAGAWHDKATNGHGGKYGHGQWPVDGVGMAAQANHGQPGQRSVGFQSAFETVRRSFSANVPVARLVWLGPWSLQAWVCCRRARLARGSFWERFGRPNMF